jgi:hypothetical protein
MIEKIDQYKILQSLELELTKIRYTTFTALISISILLPSLAFNREIISVPKINLFLFCVTVSQLLVMLGFLFFLFTIYHYWWFHRMSHIYIKKLRELEKEMNIEIYSLKKIPKLFNSIYLRFSWSLYIIGIFYGITTLAIVGYKLFFSVFSVLVLSFSLLIIINLKKTDEF